MLYRCYYWLLAQESPHKGSRVTSLQSQVVDELRTRCTEWFAWLESEWLLAIQKFCSSQPLKNISQAQISRQSLCTVLN